MPYLVDQYGNTFTDANGLPVKIVGANGAVGQDANKNLLVSLRNSAGVEPTIANPTSDNDGNGFALYTISRPELFNESTWDRRRGNTQGTLLASAARSSTTFSSNQINYNARGIIVFLDVTVASGLGGLQIRLNFIDPVTGKTAALNSLPAAVTAIGSSVYILYPGATSSGATSGVLPRTWLLGVAHGDTSSYTYSVGYALIL